MSIKPPASLPAALASQGYISEHEAAEILNIRVSTLRFWRSQRKGPAFTRWGKSPLYTEQACKDYILAHLEANKVAAATGKPLPENVYGDAETKEVEKTFERTEAFLNGVALANAVAAQ
jgi:hypothetical protein